MYRCNCFGYVLSMKIREALPEDAAAICNMLCESVTKLCDTDHKNDSEILDKWLGNKTPETLTSWINDPDGTMIVAVENDKVLAVAGILHSGEITLNYVHSTARFRGISKSLIKELEKKAVAIGMKKLSLNSTSTARQFYLSLGYKEANPETGMFGNTVYPMSKTL